MPGTYIYYPVNFALSPTTMTREHPTSVIQNPDPKPDLEALPELKKPPDPSEVLIQRNFRKPLISIRTKTILGNYIKKIINNK